jgi:hypothetical protein
MGLVSVLVDTWGKGLARTNLLSNNEGLGTGALSNGREAATGRGEEIGRGTAVDEEASNRTDFRRAVEVAGPEVALATGLGIEVGRRIEVDRAGSFVPAGTTIAQGDDLGVVETRAGGVATGLAATGTATRTVVFPLLVSFVGFLVVSLIVDRGVGESRGIDLFSRPPPCFRTGPALVFVSLAARGTRAVVLVTGVPG